MKDLILKVEPSSFVDKTTKQTIHYNKYYVEMLNPVNGKTLNCYLKPTCEYDKRLLKDYYAG